MKQIFLSTQQQRRLLTATMLLTASATALMATSDVARGSEDIICFEELPTTCEAAVPPVMRAPLDNYVGNPSNPFGNLAGKEFFLTRYEREFNGHLREKITATYNKGTLLPATYRWETFDEGSDEGSVFQDYRYEWDSRNRLIYDGFYRNTYDEYDRLIEQRSSYEEYDFLTTYEYDETGRCTKYTDSYIYPDRGRVDTYIVEYEWSTAFDKSETQTTIARSYNEDAGKWTMRSKKVETTFKDRKEKWEEEWEYDHDGNDWVLKSHDRTKVIYIIPGMANGVVVAHKAEARYGGEMRTTEEYEYEQTDLGNNTLLLKSPIYTYRYYSDGKLLDKSTDMLEWTIAAYKSQYDLWFLAEIHAKRQRLIEETGEWRFSRESTYEYNDNWQETLYEESEYIGEGIIDHTRRTNTYDELGRNVERMEYKWYNDDEPTPDLHHQMTYVGGSRSFDTMEYAYYNKDTKEWGTPHTYEYEWDTSADGQKCYWIGAKPSVLSLCQWYYVPVSMTETYYNKDGQQQKEIYRLSFNTSEELGAVENIADELDSAAGPVSVYSMAGVKVATVDSLNETSLPAGIYILKQGDKVRKLLKH